MNRLIMFFTIFAVFTNCNKSEKNLTYGSITDIDGNEYATIVIGNQEWMAENLRTTKYCNGDSISNVENANDWVNLNTGAWAHYDNDSQFEELYGKLYNWYAADDARNICPCGWHVPTHNEWTVLTDGLGEAGAVGTKMKSTIGWNENGNGTNESGFSGLPGGFRFSIEGPFYGKEENTSWWSSTETGNYNARARALSYNTTTLYNYGDNKVHGFSVRCLRD